MSAKVLDALVKKFGDAIEPTSQHGDEIAYVAREKLHEVGLFLRDDPAMLFDSPVFVTCVDLLDLPKVDLDKTPRFEVAFQLRSFKHRHRIRLKVRVPENDVRVASLADLWPAFDWQERETFDMYGIRFENHPDLRRIYLYEEFVGYPLRRDYPKEKRQPLVRRKDFPLDGEAE